jgi:hypothetical protein
MSLSLLAAGLGSLGLPLLASRVAHADDVLSRVPTVHITVAAVDSQAQLAGQLRAQGYTDVILSSTYPSPANPHPELNPTLTSHPEQTPVHSGWNGVASKDGRLVQVYVDR